MTSVLLVTCDWFPRGEPGAELIDRELRDRGVDFRWVSWTDPAVDWSSATLVVVRATWDYDDRRPEFLAWARAVGPALVNSAEVIEWNTDKAYLLELAAAGVPVVPTILVEGEEELPPAIAAFETAVVKPSVGAGGRGVVIFPSTAAGPGPSVEPGLGAPPWVVQPLVESVRTEGERSVFWLGGPVSAARKVPGGDEIRVHEEYGGSTRAAALDEEQVDLARRAMEAAEKVTGQTLAYARVDMMRLADGSLAVSELEVTEPGLYLDVLPENAAALADVVTRLL